MTPREKQLLDFIRERIETTGISPTYREMAAHFGLRSASRIHTSTESLIAQGHLVRRRAHANNSLELSIGPLVHVPTSALRAELARREQETGQ